MSFSSDFANYAKKTKISLGEGIVAVNGQVTKSIIEKTPADKGTARGNWFATFGEPSTEVDKDRREAEAIADTKKKVLDSAGKVFYLTNNLIYIRDLEFGLYPSPSKTGKTTGGYSIQAPAGFVRLAIKNVKLELRKFK